MGKIRTDERIKVVNGYDKGSYTYIPVIIVGAGESGIATACKLKSELGFDQFRCYDRQSGIGGTWWINRYPGIVSTVRHLRTVASTAGVLAADVLQCDALISTCSSACAEAPHHERNKLADNDNRLAISRAPSTPFRSDPIRKPLNSTLPAKN